MSEGEAYDVVLDDDDAALMHSENPDPLPQRSSLDVRPEFAAIKIMHSNDIASQGTTPTECEASAKALE